MPKKNCCCVVGTYIAIPCRYYAAGKFTGGDPRWAHWDGGPESIGGFGGIQTNLKGPFRFVDGQVVFDSTRKIIYMMLDCVSLGYRTMQRPSTSVSPESHQKPEDTPYYMTSLICAVHQ